MSRMTTVLVLIFLSASAIFGMGGRGCAYADVDLRVAAQRTSEHQGIILADHCERTDGGGIAEAGGIGVRAGRLSQGSVEVAGGVEVGGLDPQGSVAAAGSVAGECK